MLIPIRARISRSTKDRPGGQIISSVQADVPDALVLGMAAQRCIDLSGEPDGDLGDAIARARADGKLIKM